MRAADPPLHVQKLTANRHESDERAADDHREQTDDVPVRAGKKSMRSCARAGLETGVQRRGRPPGVGGVTACVVTSIARADPEVEATRTFHFFHPLYNPKNHARPRSIEIQTVP